MDAPSKKTRFNVPGLKVVGTPNLEPVNAKHFLKEKKDAKIRYTRVVIGASWRDVRRCRGTEGLHVVRVYG
jgi:hypothetical protein